MATDEPTFTYKALDFIHSIITYGYVAEILLFFSICLVLLTISFIILNSKTYWFIAKEQIGFFLDYIRFFLREKFNFIRSYIFVMKGWIKDNFGLRFIIVGIVLLILIIAFAIFFIYMIKKAKGG